MSMSSTTSTRAPRPEDVASPEAIINAVYEILSGGASDQRDWDRWRPLYVEGARLIPIERNEEGKLIPRVLDPEGFIRSRAPMLAAGDFHEWEVSREELRCGSIAHVWSSYEAGRTLHGPAIRRGVNSIQLWDDGSRWWILSVVWDAVAAMVEGSR
jgi:hypothetical protein